MTSDLDGDDFPPIFVSDPDWDDVGAILDRLGIPYRHVREFSGARNAIVVLNCGADWEHHVPPETIVDFVESGGVLFASDLEAGIVSTATGAEFQPADWGDEVTATVEDSELQDLLGRQELVLDFDTAAREITSLPPEARPLLRARESGSVIAYRQPHGEGEIVYTVFHNHSQTSAVEESLLQLLVMVPIAGSTDASITETHERLTRRSPPGVDTDDGDGGEGGDVRSRGDDPGDDQVALVVVPENPEAFVGDPLTVRVRDEHGDRVESAVLSHPGGSVETDRVGRCRVTFDTPGTKQLSAEKPDDGDREYVPASVTISVREK